jgi:hypothetical protein
MSHPLSVKDIERLYPEIADKIREKLSGNDKLSIDDILDEIGLTSKEIAQLKNLSK